MCAMMIMRAMINMMLIRFVYYLHVDADVDDDDEDDGYYDDDDTDDEDEDGAEILC